MSSCSWSSIRSSPHSACSTASGSSFERPAAELRDAVQTLETLPHTVVYMDAGAADAESVERTASLLRRADVAQAQGFFVNSTHFDWTTKEVAYGQAISVKARGRSLRRQHR